MAKGRRRPLMPFMLLIMQINPRDTVKLTPGARPFMSRRMQSNIKYTLSHATSAVVTCPDSLNSQISQLCRIFMQFCEVIAINNKFRPTIWI